VLSRTLTANNFLRPLRRATVDVGDPRIFGNIPKGRSWDPWRPVLIASRARTSLSEMKIFKKLSGKTVPRLPLAGQGGLRDTNSLQCRA
jgi:hypothetical protein